MGVRTPEVSPFPPYSEPINISSNSVSNNSVLNNQIR
jgi:hypothetical protein